jgi:hypothetical protein
VVGGVLIGAVRRTPAEPVPAPAPPAVTVTERPYASPV